MSRKKKNSTRRSKKFTKNAKRLAAYSAAAAATVMTTQSTANAAEKVWDISDVTVDLNSDPYLRFNMMGGVVTPTAIQGDNFADGSFELGIGEGINAQVLYAPLRNEYSGFVGTGGFTNVVSQFRYPSFLAPSDDINATKSFAANSYNFGADWGAYVYFDKIGVGGARLWPFGVPGIAGLRFKTGAVDPDDYHYGWAQITVLETPGGIRLHGFGYNDTVKAGSHPVNTVDPAPGLDGDYNSSGQVEQGDLDLVLLNWGDTVPPAGGTVPAGWTNPDFPPTAPSIDQDDLDGVLLNWGNSATANEAVVPEPTSILLLAVGAAGLGSWRRRKSVA